MTLVTCPDCDNELSSTAKRCKKCGFDMAQHPHNISERADRESSFQEGKRKEKKVGWWLLAISVPIFVITRFMLPDLPAESAGEWIRTAAQWISSFVAIMGFYSIWDNRDV